MLGRMPLTPLTCRGSAGDTSLLWPHACPARARATRARPMPFQQDLVDGCQSPIRPLEAYACVRRFHHHIFRLKCNGWLWCQSPFSMEEIQTSQVCVCVWIHGITSALSTLSSLRIPSDSEDPSHESWPFPPANPSPVERHRATVDVSQGASTTPRASKNGAAPRRGAPRAGGACGAGRWGDQH